MAWILKWARVWPALIYPMIRFLTSNPLTMLTCLLRLSRYSRFHKVLSARGRTIGNGNPVQSLYAVRSLKQVTGSSTTDLRSYGYAAASNSLVMPRGPRQWVGCPYPLINHQLIGGTGTHWDILEALCCPIENDKKRRGVGLITTLHCI